MVVAVTRRGAVGDASVVDDDGDFTPPTAGDRRVRLEGDGAPVLILTGVICPTSVSLPTFNFFRFALTAEAGDAAVPAPELLRTADGLESVTLVFRTSGVETELLDVAFTDLGELIETD